VQGAQATIRNHITCWVGSSLLFTSMATPLATASAQSNTEQTQDLESDAKKDYPNRTYTDSVRQESLKKAEAFNKSEKTDEEKIQHAIGNFFGFYFVNTRSHVTYCARLGVDISPFTKAFIAANKDIYEQSSKLLYRRGTTEEQLFKQLEPTLDSMTAKNLADLAATDKLSTTQECQLQTQNLEARITRVTFSKIMPEVSKTLLDAQ
jgi:hypothetical protein